MEKFPNLIIAGVHKGATTSLYTYLATHPEIYGSGKKEIHYFTPLRFGTPLQDESEYEKYFLKRKEEKYALDASPSYLYGGKLIIAQMKKMLPPHKVIVILRDPVDRFISNYNYLKSKQFIDQTEDLNSFIQNCVKALEKPLFDNDYSRAIMEGRYIDFIPDWIDAYQEDFKIIYFEQLTTDPLKVMIELAKWLDISDDEFKNITFTVENKTVYVKSRVLHSLALFINHNFERFFRKNHNFKVFLRTIYYGLNQKSKMKKEQNAKGQDFLHQLYADSNASLKQYLISRNMKLPAWL